MSIFSSFKGYSKEQIQQIYAEKTKQLASMQEAFKQVQQRQREIHQAMFDIERSIIYAEIYMGTPEEEEHVYTATKARGPEYQSVIYRDIAE